MGSSQQKEAATAFFTGVATNPDAPQKAQLAAHLEEYHKVICTGNELYSVAEPIVKGLIASAPRTGRLHWLLQYTEEVLRPVVQSKSAASDALLAQLRIVELVLRHVHGLVRGKTSLMLQVLSEAPSPAAAAAAADGNNGNSSEGPNVSPKRSSSTAAPNRLVHSMMEYVVKVPLIAATCATHAEITRLLLTMTASALHHGTQFSERHLDVFTEFMMSSELLDAFITVLLQRVVLWGSEVKINAPVLYRDADRTTGFRSFFSIFGGGQRQATTNSSSSTSTGTTVPSKAKSDKVSLTSVSYAELLFRHSAELASVLVSHQKGNGRNPALAFMKKLVHGPIIPFTPLMHAIASKLTVCPSLCIILYVLMYDNTGFLHYVVTESPETVVKTTEAILRLTYIACWDADASSSVAKSSSAAEKVDEDVVAVAITEDTTLQSILNRIVSDMTKFSYPFIYFMTSTLLLLLSQDRVVNSLLCTTECDPSFAVDRYTGNVSAGSLCLMVLAVGITKALNDRNEPLAAVFIPCMANIASFMNGVDAHTAQRLMAMHLMVVKKIRRAEDALSSLEGKGAVSIASNQQLAENVQSVREVGEMFLRQLAMITEAIEGLLRGTGRDNEALIYEMLYNRDKIVPSPAAPSPDANASANAASADAPEGGIFLPRMYATLRNMSDMIHNFEAEIASAPEASTPKEILAVIRRSNFQEALSMPTPPPSAAAGDAISSAASSTTTATTTKADSAATLGGGGGGGGRVDLLYTYEESPNSYDFFGPFVWATLLDDAYVPGGILWTTRVGSLPLFPQVK